MTRLLQFFLTVAVLILVGRGTPLAGPQALAAQAIETRPGAVILLIADGAGVGHWTLASAASQELAVQRMPVGGLIDTQGSDHEVTGSGPSATALATGVRSFMGALGVGPDGLPRETVLEAAHARGWATGLVTTASIVDATPAAFAAHVSSRSQTVEILRQMTDLPVHVLLGGGSFVLEQARQQGRGNLLRALRDRYTTVPNAAALDRVITDTTTTLLGFFARGEMPRATERSPSLADMTRAALSVLEHDPDGFFLMAENEGSDSYAHQNLPQAVITAEMLGFDAAVGVALEYQSRHPETLVVVTADHETGGIHLEGNSARDIVLGYGTTSHSAALVPLFAMGPGAERLGGLKRNDEIGRALIDLVRGPAR